MGLSLSLSPRPLFFGLCANDKTHARTCGACAPFFDVGNDAGAGLTGEGGRVERGKERGEGGRRRRRGPRGGRAGHTEKKHPPPPMRPLSLRPPAPRARAVVARASPPDGLRNGLPEGLFLAPRQPRRRSDWSVGPALDLSVDDAVAAQMEALARNDRPYRDFGVEVCVCVCEGRVFRTRGGSQTWAAARGALSGESAALKKTPCVTARTCAPPRPRARPPPPLPLPLRPRSRPPPPHPPPTPPQNLILFFSLSLPLPHPRSSTASPTSTPLSGPPFSGRSWTWASSSASGAASTRPPWPPCCRMGGGRWSPPLTGRASAGTGEVRAGG